MNRSAFLSGKILEFMDKTKISLNIKLVIYTILMMVIIAVMVSSLVIYHERFLLIDQLRERGMSLAYNISRTSAYGVLTEDNLILDSFISSVIGEKDVEYVSITNADAVVLSSNNKDIISKKDPYINTDATEELMVKEMPKRAFNIQAPIKITPPESMPEPEAGLVLASKPKESGRKEIIGFLRLVISMAEINKQMIEAKRRIFFITLVFIIITVSFTILFTTKIIINPLHSLLNLTQQVAKGNLEVKSDIRSSDEIGELASAFNSMTRDLKQSRTKIEQYSKTLEESVNQRTKELQLANEQLKRTQAELIQSAKMTAIGQLGAGVAHELNNPLGGVLGYAQYILQKMGSKDFTKEDFATCRKYIDNIERETKRCKEIVENLLSFSRKSQEIIETDLRKVLDDTLSILHHQLTLKGVNVSTDYDEDLALVQANPNQLQQVFTNIVLNAQQAMPEGGDLAITARNSYNDNPQDKNKVVVRFTDTGCGIPQENLEKIFDPFFTTKIEWKGTGLGLSVSYEIIQAHKGSINVESEAGVGTIFTITLPAMI